MRSQFTVRSLFVVTLIAGILTAIAISFERAHRNAGVLQESSWPGELRELLKVVERESPDIKSRVDVRLGRFMELECLWRMPASELAITEHIQRFDLTASANGGESQRLLSHPSFIWKQPKNGSIDVYAFPKGLPGAKKGESEYVLVHDKAVGDIYFLHFHNF